MIERPSPDYLRECFQHRDGALYWRERPASHFINPAVCMAFNTKTAGKKAGKLNGRGYVTVGLRIDGKAISMAAHRVVWAMNYGKWPELHIDHINRVRDDNRIKNLREVTPVENSNNSSWKRVHPCVHPARRGQFSAQVRAGDKSIHIGVFSSEQDANSYRLMVVAEMEKLARHLAKKSNIGRPRKDGETFSPADANKGASHE